MNQIVIGNIEFPTRKKAEEYIREIVRVNRHKEIRPGSSTFDFVYSLLTGHPNIEEKIKKLSHFFVGADGFGNFCFFAVNGSGQKVDFSWRICLNGKPKPSIFNLICAMRESISQQIINFKEANFNGICEICNKNISNCHIDHVVHFKKISNDFLKEYKGNIPISFDSCPKTYRAKFKVEDISFKNSWNSYHLNNATLRCACESCNLKRTKYHATDQSIN